MDLVSLLVEAVKTAPGGRIETSHMVTAVGKLFARGQMRSFAHDLVAFDHQLGAIRVKHDPFAAEEGHTPIGAIADGDEIDEGMRLVRRQAHSAVVVAEFVETGGETG